MLTDALRPDDPTSIGPYRLLGRIGAGGMGVVFVGEDSEGRRAAIKLIRSDLVGDSSFRVRFGREVEAARRVQSPVTAAVLAADPDAADPWVAFEYVEAPNLADVVARGVPRLSAAVGILSGVAEALVAIHAVGLVHRDLKPSNVLVPPDGVRVIDFGIAAALDSSKVTSTGMVLGTPGWWSPEQVTGTGVGPASDVFSWGLLAAYVCTGRHPFGGGEQTPVALMFRTVEHDPDLDGVPAQLLPVITSALQKDPAKRPTAAALVDTMLPRVAAQASTRPEPQPVVPVPRSTPTVMSTPTPMVVPTAPERNRKVPAAVAGGIAIVLVGLIAVLVASRGSSGSKRPPTSLLAGGGTTTAAPATTTTAAPATTSAPVDLNAAVIGRLDICRTDAPCQVLLRKDGFRAGTTDASILFVGYGPTTGGERKFTLVVAGPDGNIMWSASALGSYDLSAATQNGTFVSQTTGIQQGKSGNYLLPLNTGAHSAYVVVLGFQHGLVTDFGSVVNARFFSDGGTTITVGDNGYEAIQVSNSDYKPSFAQGTMYTATYDWDPSQGDYVFMGCATSNGNGPPTSIDVTRANCPPPAT